MVKSTESKREWWNINRWMRLRKKCDAIIQPITFTSSVMIGIPRAVRECFFYFFLSSLFRALFGAAVYLQLVTCHLAASQPSAGPGCGLRRNRPKCETMFCVDNVCQCGAA